MNPPLPAQSLSCRRQRLANFAIPLYWVRFMETLRTHSELTTRQEMVEPLEETRNELIFATEPVLSSLDLSIPRGSRHMPLVELDEIEVR